MMNWNGNWGGSGWWALMCLMMVVVGGLAIWALMTYARKDAKPGLSSAEQMLDERLARGEISAAEFEELRTALRTHTPG